MNVEDSIRRALIHRAQTQKALFVTGKIRVVTTKAVNSEMPIYEAFIVGKEEWFAYGRNAYEAISSLMSKYSDELKLSVIDIHDRSISLQGI